MNVLFRTTYENGAERTIAPPAYVSLDDLGFAMVRSVLYGQSKKSEIIVDDEVYAEMEDVKYESNG